MKYLVATDKTANTINFLKISVSVSNLFFPAYPLNQLPELEYHVMVAIIPF